MPPHQKSGILAQLESLFPPSTHKIAFWGVSFCLLCGAVAAIAVAVPRDPQPENTVVTELTTPSTKIVALPAQPFAKETDIRKGDTPPAILARLGIEDPDLEKFIQTQNEGRRFMNALLPDRTLEAHTQADGIVQSLLVHPAHSEKAVELVRKDASFSVHDLTLPVERKELIASGRIESSLFASTDELGLPDSMALALVKIFADQINFRSDLRKGDPFSLLYEAYYYKGTLLRRGRILAASFSRNGQDITALWYPDAPHGGSYFTPEGKSLSKGFLRSPVAYTRISSKFSMRFHPFLKKWRKHTGTDFAAPRGTQIHAAADGKVDFVGVQHGYGNIVVVKHSRGYSTAYAHMSRFAKGLHRGEPVKQGEVIGYVGQTGWATGPHLHYEIRINNVPVDPLKTALPGRPPLSGIALQKFRLETSPLLSSLTQDTHLALSQK